MYPENNTYDSKQAAKTITSAYEDTRKALARTAISQYLITVTENLKAQQVALTKKLKSSESTMKTFATKTLVNSMDEALTGKAADAADTYLTDTVKKPDFDNPIQGV